jgi:hypothetical protein
VRAAATYPGLPGEVSALLHAGAAGGRDALGVLPTPGLAARTRALLPAFTTADPSLRDEQPHTSPGPRPRVLVDRRDGPRTPTAGLVAVLAGPVRAGATPVGARPPRRAGTGTALAGWARGLAAGGTLVLLCPPQPGQSDPADRPSGWVSEWIQAAKAAGLAYAQHIVLVHLPVADDGFLASEPYERGSAPFHPVHTDAFVFTANSGVAQAQPADVPSAVSGTAAAEESAAADGAAVAGE